MKMSLKALPWMIPWVVFTLPLHSWGQSSLQAKSKNIFNLRVSAEKELTPHPSVHLAKSLSDSGAIQIKVSPAEPVKRSFLLQLGMGMTPLKTHGVLRTGSSGSAYTMEANLANMPSAMGPAIQMGVGKSFSPTENFELYISTDLELAATRQNLNLSFPTGRVADGFLTLSRWGIAPYALISSPRFLPNWSYGPRLFVGEQTLMVNSESTMARAADLQYLSGVSLRLERTIKAGLVARFDLGFLRTQALNLPTSVFDSDLQLGVTTRW